MFLAELGKNQKKAFMVIAQSMISSDGILNDKENLMMEQYKVEMNLDEKEATIISLDSAIETLKTAIPVIKKRVLFELIGLAYSDADYATEEVALVEKIRTAFDLSPNFVDESIKAVTDLTDLYSRIGAMVNE